MLFNVGFQEAMKDLDWDCLIFHDVDHIPESDRNYYGCGQMPRHFATKLDKYMYLYVSPAPGYGDLPLKVRGAGKVALYSQLQL